MAKWVWIATYANEMREYWLVPASAVPAIEQQTIEWAPGDLIDPTKFYRRAGPLKTWAFD